MTDLQEPYLALSQKMIRKLTDNLIDEVHEWFYQQLGGDPDELYENIAGQISFAVEDELRGIMVIPEKSRDE